MNRRWFCLLMSTTAWLACLPSGWAEEDRQPSNGEALMVTRKGGTRFLSLADWPVKRRQGVVTVAPLEEYLSMEFGQVRSDFAKIDQRLEGLEQRVQTLEKDRAALEEQLRLLLMEKQGAAQEVTHGPTTQEPEAAQRPSGGSP